MKKRHVTGVLQSIKIHRPPPKHIQVITLTPSQKYKLKHCVNEQDLEQRIFRILSAKADFLF